ncbi:hypothetical protein GYMLUDRAFT_73350 [Collybiopsis luxurians FD-317 M1]|uniref:Uncharacterized protein n=1 Tax=Collybiopsis luxurians FD-317 M1 TaxID=944289 RepID=A0A0D0CQL5_9AGAR|nr:hypothetical protein GYMLUDRAFT_73350 [Collybiopsis luxurians FD-317 M1]
MAHYPFRHSTYYTRDDVEFISELPPMNSEEDLLQELQTYGRNLSYPPTPARYSRQSRPLDPNPIPRTRKSLVSRVFMTKILKTKVKGSLETVKHTARRKFRR